MGKSKSFNINKLSKNHPHDGEYQLITVNKKAHLTAIYTRLVDEVGDIVAYIDKRNHKEPRIGFFALVRMLTPILEATATAEGIQPYVLLERLGNPMPYVTWCLYRHGFLHNDEFIIAGTKDGLGSPSGIFLADPIINKDVSDLLNDGRLANPLMWYRQLVDYLDHAITDCPESERIQIINALIFEEKTRGDKEIRESHRRITDENMRKSANPQE